MQLLGRRTSAISTPKSAIRQRRSAGFQADDYRPADEAEDARSGAETPSLEAVAVGVLRHPELLQEIFRRLAWLEKDQLIALRQAIDQALQHRDDVLAACANGSFGRDYVVKPVLESLIDGGETPPKTSGQ